MVLLFSVHRLVDDEGARARLLHVSEDLSSWPRVLRGGFIVACVFAGRGFQDVVDRIGRPRPNDAVSYLLGFAQYHD
jgi:hypothetical protein